jgi:hypothetical protein
MILQKKKIAIAQTYRADSAPQTPKSALHGLMQRLGLTLLACALVIGVTGSAGASEARDEAAVRALGDNFAKALVQKNTRARASLFTEDGTFLTPVGDFLQGRAAGWEGHPRDPDQLFLCLESPPARWLGRRAIQGKSPGSSARGHHPDRDGCCLTALFAG